MKLLYHGIGYYKNGTPFGPSSWPHHDLFIVQKGALRFQTDAGSMSLRDGDAVIIPPHVRFHGVSKNDACTMWVLHFQHKGFQPRHYSRSRQAGVWMLPKAVASELAGRVMERLSSLYHGASEWHRGAEVYFFALLEELRFVAQTSDTPWDRLTFWAKGHLSENMTVEKLARQAGFSISHFRTLFEAQTGQPPGRFLLELRMKEARRLLLESPFNLKEISTMIGYGDQVAFHRAFATYNGITPAQFRKRHGGKV